MKKMRRTILREPFVLIGLIIIGLIFFICLAGPIVLREDPTLITYVSSPQAPTISHLFGTDDLGRDILIRIMYGGRISIIVALVAVCISLFIGTIIGAVSGFYGGFVDDVIMRLLDVLMSIPTIFLLLTIQVILKPSIFNVIIVIGLTSWMGVARIVRAEVLSLSSRDFVKAARAYGYKNTSIIFKYILPNAMGPLFVTAILSMGGAILTESALSYFGLGVQPPWPSWGNMLYSAQDYLLDAWWLTFFPGFFILMAVLGLNFIGDGLYRIFNPKT